MLRDRNIHSDLKKLCEKLFEEMYEKLAKEKQIIDLRNSLIPFYKKIYKHIIIITY